MSNIFMDSSFDYFRSCLYCDKLYKIGKGHAKYCSEDCYILGSKPKHKPKERNKNGMFDKVCAYCNEKFEAEFMGKLYCSDICRRTNLQKVNKEKREKSKKLKVPPGDAFDMYPDTSRSERISKGKAEQKKILTCSVDCLLDELGDLE